MPVLKNAKHEIDCLRRLLAYDPITGSLHWRVDRCRVRAGDLAGQPHPRGYWTVTANQGRYLAHRLAWAIHYGSWPERHIDHINGNKLDNSIANLRLASVAENARNGRMRRTNTSGFKGVSYIAATGRWRATIMVDGKQRWLGTHPTPEAAHAAYAVAAHQMHGEFARAA